MGEARLFGTPPVEVVFRRSRAARRLSLRVSSLDGRVTLTVPDGVPERQAVAFAEEKAGWIRSALDRQAPQVQVGPGTVLSVGGRALLLETASVRSARAEADRLLVPARRPAKAAEHWLRAAARDRLSAACDDYAGQIGRPVARLAISDPRSRWGSCSSAGRLMFSWRLVLAPPEVLDYVAAHEAAHLREMNHGSAFWALVDALCPGWRTQRAWLRNHGAALHRFRFDD